MTDEQVVCQVHKYAMSFLWTGFWRIHSTDCIRDEYCIGGPSDSELLAWADARSRLVPQPPQPTFAHSLAGFLTRNGQTGDWTEMEKEIDQFMEDSKLEVTRAT